MTTLEVSTPYTPDEIARLSRQTGRHYELVRGTLVEKQMSTRANWIASQVSYLLKSVYPTSRAYVFVEQPTYCFGNPDQMRKPDVALVWAERLASGLGDDELEIAPDLVVEVVSPTNTVTSQFERVSEYLAAGVPVVWVVDPPRRWVIVFRRDGSIAWRRAEDALKDDPFLPGLNLKVADIFPPETVAPAENPSPGQ